MKTVQWISIAMLALLGACKTGAPAADAPAEEPMATAESAHDGHQHQHEHKVGDANHRFDDVDKWSKVFDDPARDAWQKPDEVVALMGLTPGMVVADIGAGTGYFLGRLSTAVGAEGKVLGLDIEQSLVDHMNKRAADSGWANVEARVIPMDGPGVDDGVLDRVLIVDTWHHIGEREAYSAKLAQALKPGGKVYVVDFTMETEKGPPPSHRLASDVVIAELQAGGFSTELAEETLPDQYVVVATRSE